MNTAPSSATCKCTNYFYSIASLSMLIFMFIGFRMFYMNGQAFPGRELTPPIRTLLITHGIIMTLWMLIATVQPFLVATGKRQWHRMLGRIGAVVALLALIVGWQVGIAATRVNPPEMHLFGLAPREFMAIPTLSVTFFALLVAYGIMQRRRPDVHRPVMLMASLSVVSAAVGRIPILNAWYAGTILEHYFSAFLVTSILALIYLAIWCAYHRKLDRPFAIAVGTLILASVSISLIAKTSAWLAFTNWLVG